MKTNVTRRDLLTLGGGVAVGSMLTPAPWLLIDDLAIWTQNWKWIPVPPKGARSQQKTVCSLCPAGCAVEAGCVGAIPVALKAAAGGTPLCSLGITGHHLPWHPARLNAPVRVTVNRGEARLTAVPREAIIREIADTMRAPGRGTVAVLDFRPGRSMSWAWRNLLAGFEGAAVIPAPASPGASLRAMRDFAPHEPGEWAPDLDEATAILSFGAPLADGWGGVETRARLMDGMALRVIQVEPGRSATAALASRWIPARPGSEGVVALGVASALASGSPEIAARCEGILPLLGRMTPERAAGMAGIRVDAIFEAAAMLQDHPRSLALAGEDFAGGRFDPATELAILSLNVILGRIGAEGGLIIRAPLPDPIDGARLAPMRELEDTPDASIRLLIVDGSAGEAPLPWPLVARKLAPGALVVALSPFAAGSALHAHRIIPVPAYLEAIQEVPGACDVASTAFSISRPLLGPRAVSVDPASMIREIAALAEIEMEGDWSSTEELVAARIAQIHRSGAGRIDEGGVAAGVAELGSADELLDAMLEGARWTAEPVYRAIDADITAEMGHRMAAIEDTPREHLVILPKMSSDAAWSAAVSPLFTKLHQESGLRRESGVAVVNPATARARGLRPGRKTVIETGQGRVVARVEVDHGVMPEVIELMVGPTALALGQSRNRVISNSLDVCGSRGTGWRCTPAAIEEA
jgi:menaquinone reductase, molybdopterin-binding-like subunit